MLAALPALAVMARAFSQTTPSAIPITGINHVTLAVSDVKRSVDFYQGLFGMPIVSRSAAGANLGIGAGPQFLGLSSAGAAAPNISHICFGVENFNVERVTAALAARGLAATNRGNAGQLYFTDADGILIQLQDSRYCGGSGPLGSVCTASEPSPKKGLLALKGWSLSQRTSGAAEEAGPRGKRGPPRGATSENALMSLILPILESTSSPVAPLYGTNRYSPSFSPPGSQRRTSKGNASLGAAHGRPANGGSAPFGRSNRPLAR